MAKKRLNMGHRDLMKRLVREIVVHDQEAKNKAEAQMRGALTRLRRSIVKRFAPDSTFEKNVLLKYSHLVSLPSRIRIKIEKAQDDDIGKWLDASLIGYGNALGKKSVVVFKLPDAVVNELLVPAGAIKPYHRTPVSKETFDQYVAAQDACAAVYDETEVLRQKYYALIDASRTFEDVEAVWPRVGLLREKICGTSTADTVLSSETIDTIQAHEKTIEEKEEKAEEDA